MGCVAPTHPVLSVECPLLQGSLQSLSDPSCLLKLIHQLFSVLQLFRLDDGLQSGDIALTGLLQRGDGQTGQSLLMGQVSARDPSRRYGLNQVTGFHQATGFRHPHLYLRDKAVAIIYSPPKRVCSLIALSFDHLHLKWLLKVKLKSSLV